MPNSTPSNHTTAFMLHAIGAAFLLGFVLLLVAHEVFSPKDLFLPYNFNAAFDILQFATLAFVFYGFSLVLLRVCPLTIGWGAVYAASSWLLFTSVLFPALPTSGMMRRVASLFDYEFPSRSVHQEFLLFGTIALLGFAVAQAGYLWFACKHLFATNANRHTQKITHSKSSSPEKQ